MMTQETEKVRKQMQMVCIDDLVPRNHLLRLIDKAIDWTFIYDLVRDTYSDGMGRPSIDPVTLIKIPLIQYLYGIKSMRQTIKEIEVNMAYRWFLGLELYFFPSGKPQPLGRRRLDIHSRLVNAQRLRYIAAHLRDIRRELWLLRDDRDVDVADGIISNKRASRAGIPRCRI